MELNKGKIYEDVSEIHKETENIFEYLEPNEALVMTYS